MRKTPEEAPKQTPFDMVDVLHKIAAQDPETSIEFINSCGSQKTASVAAAIIDNDVLDLRIQSQANSYIVDVFAESGTFTVGDPDRGYTIQADPISFLFDREGQIYLRDSEQLTELDESQYESLQGIVRSAIPKKIRNFDTITRPLEFEGPEVHERYICENGGIVARLMGSVLREAIRIKDMRRLSRGTRYGYNHDTEEYDLPEDLTNVEAQFSAFLGQNLVSGLLTCEIIEGEDNQAAQLDEGSIGLIIKPSIDTDLGRYFEEGVSGLSQDSLILKAGVHHNLLAEKGTEDDGDKILILDGDSIKYLSFTGLATLKAIADNAMPQIWQDEFFDL